MESRDYSLKPKTLLVSAAVLIDSNTNKILLAERNKGHLAGTFEFPGGKVEYNESPEEALVRELEEELGISVSTKDLMPVTFASHGYDKFHLLMPLYATASWQGTLGSVGREGQKIVWVTASELQQGKHPMPPADEPLIEPIVRFMNKIDS
jgi:8-oxo-dGTP diphosphatase